MLIVITIGDGLKGKKTERFLYKYGNGGHIFIMSLCHAIFLSLTDFVKHANHIDWSNPMMHIIVNLPPPCKLLSAPNNRTPHRGRAYWPLDPWSLIVKLEDFHTYILAYTLTSFLRGT